VQLIASGARKADGDPRGPITEGAVEAAQERVDALADLFFEWVAEARGMTPDAVRSLEAGIVVGRAALAAGLADGIGSLGEALAMVAGAGVPAAAGDEVGMTDEEKARAALQAIVDGDGDDKSKARARAALAAMDDSE
jgi:ClpP class serine protease